MGKLNQLIAVLPGKKKTAEAALTAAYQLLSKPDIFEGLARTYQPKDEDGDKLPSENKIVQVKVATLIEQLQPKLVELFDAVATQDVANCEARGPVTIAGETLCTLPVTHLLFLEKKLVDLHTFVSKLPTLAAGEKWKYAESVDAFEAEPATTFKTKKVLRNHVKAEATDKFPAQVDVYTEDAVVGTWTTTKLSGAFPLSEKHAMLERVEAVQAAVKTAREIANSMEVKPFEYAKNVLAYIFGN